MNDRTAISVQEVTVVFRPLADRKPTLRRTIGQGKHKRTSTLTALDDVSLEIRKGESFGIVGSNGAGKSTLLKVIARTLRPDGGHVTVNGKTSTLLQLGLGMKPELTGSRNIYLGGLAAGMRTKEIDAKYDWIVDYADIGEAINRAVSTYSSGMFSRLAFAVGMALEPNILLLDEILAVGDEAFQQKSMATMKTLLADSGTIVFVSHSLPKVEEFCDRVAWLDHGQIRAVGDPAEVIEEYRKAVL